MALVSDAKITLLEEPSDGLDKESKKKLLQLVKNVCAQEQKHIIISTVSFEEAILGSTQICWMVDGSIKGILNP